MEITLSKNAVETLIEKVGKIQKLHSLSSMIPIHF